MIDVGDRDLGGGVRSATEERHGTGGARGIHADAPGELVGAVRAHGDSVVAGDDRAVLDDFLSDRRMQLILSAQPPDGLESRELVVLEPTPVGAALHLSSYGVRWDAYIEYRSGDAARTTAVLRSTWVRHDGRWCVAAVRNVPDEPPEPMPSMETIDPLERPFWDGLADGELRMPRCGACAEWFWTPRPLCPACGSGGWGYEPVDAVGTVFSWTRTWQPFDESLRGHLPYADVLVSLTAAGGCRVLGVLLDADRSEIRIGSQVRGVIDRRSGRLPYLRWETVS